MSEERAGEAAGERTAAAVPGADPAPGAPPVPGAPPAPADRARRLAKVEALRSRGVDPYPVRFDRTDLLGALRDRFGGLPPGEETDVGVRVAGRLVLIRRQGRLTFATMRDGSGSIQLFVSRGVVGADAHEAFDDLDLGDWVGVEGTVMTTRKGELSVKVERVELLAKALRPLPDKWHGLADVDTRFRQRYVDLIVNPEARRVLDIRHAAIAAIRAHLVGEGFIEVETPVLSLEAGGATARPFVTHHNALDLDLYLRIALELHLKRLVVGGMERVFEVSRVFRNEGIDTRHNPEFTMLEAYQALADYHDMMDLTEALVVAAARAALGTAVVTLDGRDVDLSPPWPRRRMLDLLREHAGVDVHPAMPLHEARVVADSLGVAWEERWGSGKIVAELYDELVEPALLGPVFVYDYPREVSPLARAHRDDPSLVERFEAVVGGRELANAYSELNDPIDQRGRFEAEAALRAAGDLEAGTVDEDFLRALEFGMPPTGGLGVGIDRLVMVLAGVASIREVILFPTLRPEVPGPGPGPGPGPAPGPTLRPEA
ncbi:MAG: lysine--tRNA ligase [Acidimicrobiales bacterium]|nr:lysine--tRNA ligase [Acidimicrobiales bacterium]